MASLETSFVLTTNGNLNLGLAAIIRLLNSCKRDVPIPVETKDAVQQIINDRFLNLVRTYNVIIPFIGMPREKISQIDHQYFCSLTIIIKQDLFDTFAMSLLPHRGRVNEYVGRFFLRIMNELVFPRLDPLFLSIYRPFVIMRMNEWDIGNAVDAKNVYVDFLDSDMLAESSLHSCLIKSMLVIGNKFETELIDSQREKARKHRALYGF